MANTFIPARRNNPCPVCSDATGKCRTTDSELILCMTLEQAAGWKGLGLNKNGQWNMFVPATESSAEDIERRREQNEIRKRQQRADDERRQNEAMPAMRRNIYYRDLLGQLDLHPDDRADLERRGYTAEQIKEAGYKSVERWQRLESQLPPTLPGVSETGKSLAVAHPGYLCPVIDVDGRIVGFQIRLRNPSEDSGKSRWLSSKTAKREFGPQPRTKEFFENPLTVHGTGAQVGLAEGIGAKPSLAAIRTGFTVVGAAGGQWASSPKTLEATLEKIAKPGDVITLFTDHGDKQKSGPMSRWAKTAELLKDLGYGVRVWAGSADIDEVPDSEIEAKGGKAAKPRRGKTEAQKLSYASKKAKQETAEWIETLKFIDATIQGDEELGVIRTKIEKTLRSKQQFSQEHAVIGYCPQLTLATMGTRKIYALDCQKGTGKTSTSIASIVKAAIEVGQRILIVTPLIALCGANASVLRKQTGFHGGQILTQPEWMGLKEQADGGSAAAKKKLAKVRAIITCPESLHLFHDQRFEVVVVDEVNDVVRRVQQGNLGNQPRINRKVFADKLAIASTIVIANDQLYVPAVEAVQRCARLTDEQTELIQRRRPQSDAEVELYVGQSSREEKWDGTKTGHGRMNIDFMAWLHSLEQDLLSGQKILIPCGAQKKIREIQKYLAHRHPEIKGAAIDGQFTPKNVKESFTNSADGFLNMSELSYLFVSPFVNSGVSIDGLHFDAQYEYISSLETATGASQRGERMRDILHRSRAKKRAVYIGTEMLAKRPPAEVLTADYWRKQMEVDAALSQGTVDAAEEAGLTGKIARESRARAVDLEDCKELPELMAIEAREIHFKKESLIAEWEANGWNVKHQTCPLTPELAEVAKEFKCASEVLTSQLARIMAKLGVPSGEAKSEGQEAEEAREPQSVRELLSARKEAQARKLGEDFDGLNDPYWQAAWEASPSARGKLESLQALEFYKSAIEGTSIWSNARQMFAAMALVSAMDGVSAKTPELPSTRKIIDKVEMLLECPYLAEAIKNPETTYNKNTAGVKAAAEWAREHAQELTMLSKQTGRLKGFQFTGKTPDIKCLHKLLGMLGLDGTSVGRGKGKYAPFNYQLKPLELESEELALLEEVQGGNVDGIEIIKCSRIVSLSEAARDEEKAEKRARQVEAFLKLRDSHDLYRRDSMATTSQALSSRLGEAFSDDAVTRFIKSIAAQNKVEELAIKEILFKQVLRPYSNPHEHWSRDLIELWEKQVADCKTRAEVEELADAFDALSEIQQPGDDFGLKEAEKPPEIYTQTLLKLA